MPDGIDQIAKVGQIFSIYWPGYQRFSVGGARFIARFNDAVLPGSVLVEQNT